MRLIDWWTDRRYFRAKTKPWSYALIEVVHHGELAAISHDELTGHSIAILRDGRQIEYDREGSVVAESWPPPASR